MRRDVWIEGDDGLRIGFYDDWMADQVVDMFVAQYGGDRATQALHFERFYEASFQRPHGLRLVALDGERVCGFQTYFYWPYRCGDERLRSFQSGSSLVSPEYRGRQIFARLLNFLSQIRDRPQVDFLMGFPVEMSYGSFLRNGWHNPLNLRWYVRPIRPLSIARASAPPDAAWRFDRNPEPIDVAYPAGLFALSKDADFQAWRRSYGDRGPGYLYFHHGEGGKAIRFELKPNRRGRLQELVLGDIVRSSEDPALLARGLRELVRAVRGHRFVTLLSVALNPDAADGQLVAALRRRGFFRIKRSIYFIVKPVDGRPELLDPRCWQLYRSDIDTW